MSHGEETVERLHCCMSDECVTGKGQSLCFIFIFEDTSSFKGGRTGSLDLFIRWHTETLLMTPASEPSVKHVDGNWH